MATNIDKALYRAPTGLAAALAAPDELEIEIINPEGEEDPQEVEEPTLGFADNLAESMDESDLQTLVYDLDSEVDDDKASRSDWERTYTDGLKLLGLKYEERTEPWAGACGVTHPMLTEAMVRFQSETITETFPAQGPVRTKIIGEETPAKTASAKRVQEDMNYLITEKMEFRPEHERMLWNLAPAGAAFKKVYFDPTLGRPVSVFVPAEDIVLPYGVTDVFASYRVTHEMRKTKNEILKLQYSGFYRDIDLGEPTRGIDDIKQAKDEETGFSDLNDDRYLLRECHVDLDLPGFEDTDADGPTGIALPYVVTFIKGGDVLSIRRNWKESDPLCLKRQHFVQYSYIPGFGPYAYGLIHLVGGYARSATSLLRQLIDAGTLSNLPGGLKSRGLRIKGDDTPIAPGEFRDVDVSSGAIRDNILPLPYKEPSSVLAGLLGTIVDEGRRLAATADMEVGDMSAQAPVGTTLALLERQLKVMSAIQARVHYSLKQELRLIAEIVKDNLEEDPDYDYEPVGGSPKAKREDYENTDVLPVSDPNAATLSQRVVQYQAVIQMAQMAPDIYDLPQLHRGMLEILGLKNADKLVPLPDDLQPTDPITENMQLLRCEPVKAFYHQDQEAHIQAHNALAQDPLITGLVGQGPKAQQIAASMSAHIAEHLAYSYRKKIEEQLGMSLPDPAEGKPMTKEVEVTLSRLMAQAAQQVLQASQSVKAQQQAQQQAQDPVLQMQQQELQIKSQEVQIKGQVAQSDVQIAQQKAQLESQKMQSDAQIAQQRGQLEAQKMQAELQKMQLEAQMMQQEMELKKKQFMADTSAVADKLDIEREKLQGTIQVASMQVSARAQAEKTKLEADQESKGMQIGADLAKHHTKLQHEGAKAAREHARGQQQDLFARQQHEDNMAQQSEEPTEKEPNN